MSTTLVKPAEVERKWYLLDAAGKSLGHVAAEAAVLLRGKQKVDYTPNVDCGDFVVVINCDQEMCIRDSIQADAEYARLKQKSE